MAFINGTFQRNLIARESPDQFCKEPFYMVPHRTEDKVTSTERISVLESWF